MNRCKFGSDIHVLKPVYEYDMNITYNIVPVFAKESPTRERKSMHQEKTAFILILYPGLMLIATIHQALNQFG